MSKITQLNELLNNIQYYKDHERQELMESILVSENRVKRLNG